MTFRWMTVAAASLAGLGLSVTAQADALSVNTATLNLSFSPAVTNTFGYSIQTSATYTSGPGSVHLTVPSDTAFAVPNRTDSKKSSATLTLRLANLSGSGPPTPAAATFDPHLLGNIVYDLNNTAVDLPPLDQAASTMFVDITLNGVNIYTNTITSSSPDDVSGALDLSLPPILLPANSVSKLIATVRFAAVASSSRPPAPPFPPVTPPLPEPSDWVLLLAGFTLLGGMMRERRGRVHAQALSR